MMSGQLELDLPVDSPMIGKIKNERALMAYNFFSLSRERVTELPIYDDGVVRIEVTGTRHNTVQEHFREAGVMRGDGLWA
jgi:hypothetical protein